MTPVTWARWEHVYDVQSRDIGSGYEVENALWCWAYKCDEILIINDDELVLMIL